MYEYKERDHVPMYGEKSKRFSIIILSAAKLYSQCQYGKLSEWWELRLLMQLDGKFG